MRSWDDANINDTDYNPLVSNDGYRTCIAGRIQPSSLTCITGTMLYMTYIVVTIDRTRFVTASVISMFNTSFK